MHNVLGLLLLIPSLASVSRAVCPPPINPKLVDCLKKANLGPIVPDDSVYDQVATPFNERLRWQPAAIVYPSTTSEVGDAVNCGAENQIKVNARCGGHSYAAYGLGGEDGHLVISLDNLRDIQMTGTNATIGAGNRLGDVALFLWNNGKRAMAHGTCPYVGIGGHAGQGGFGLASRAWGLLADQVVGMEIVLANGTAVNVSDTEHPDLFWAARGAGASFGIITSFTTITHAAPESIAFSYTYANYTAEDASKGVQTWQNFVNDPQNPLDTDVGLQLYVTPGDGPNGAVFSIHGVYYNGTDEKLATTMSPLLNALGTPTSNFSENHDWIQSVLYLSGGLASSVSDLNTTDRREYSDYFFATSTFVDHIHLLNTSTTDALMNYLYNAGTTSRVKQWFVYLDLYGGGNSAVSMRDSDFNAFDARDALYSIQYYGTIPNTVAPADGVKFIQGMKQAIESQNITFKEYVNYIDSTYTAEDAHDKYYPTHTERLKTLKDMYDPNRTITHPQDF